MTPQVIQFQCSSCQAHLTVPVHLAGVTGPCPKCGNTITSPAADSPPPPPQPAPAPSAWPSAPASLTPPPATAPDALDVQAPAAPVGGAMPAFPPAPTWTGKSESAQPAAIPSPPATAPIPAPAPAATPLPPRSPEPAVHSLLAGFHSPTPEPRPGSKDASPLPGSSLLPPLEGSPAQPASDTSPLLASVLNPNLPTPGTSSTLPSPRETTPAPAKREDKTRAPLPPFPNRPSKGSNLFRRFIALLLLLGCVALLAYAARAPLTDLYYRHLAQYFHPTTEPGPTAEPTVSKAAEKPAAPPENPPSPPKSTLATPPTPAPSPTPTPTPTPAPTPALAAPSPPLTPAVPPTPPTATPTAPALPPSPPATPAMPEVIQKAEPATPQTQTPAKELPATLPNPAPAPGTLMEVPGSPASAGPLTLPAPGNDPNATSVIPDEAKPAAEALIKFLASDTLEAKRKFILGADDPQINALIERYYSQTPAAPIPVTTIGFIRHDPNPEVGSGMQSVFMVASPEWAYPIPVMVQETKSGLKLDWIAFIEFKDNWLHKFVQEFRPNRGRFHVSIKRTHYFDRDVPDLENKDCFLIQPPQEDFEVAVFVPKNTPLADMLRRELTWSTQYAYVLAEIQWRDEGPNAWVELTAVPQLNWYITTEPAPPSPPAAESPSAESKGKGKGTK